MTTKATTNVTGEFTPSQITNVSLKNENYTTFRLKIRLKDASDPDSFDFKPGDVVNCDYNYSTNEIRYEGKLVQMLDLNDGSSSDDILMNGHGDTSNNAVYYNSKVNLKGTLINFETGRYYTVQDADGIGGAGSASIKTSQSGEAELQMGVYTGLIPIA